MDARVRRRQKNKKIPQENASLTVEAALVLPIFLLCIFVFLYFFQIIYVQEHIQEAITKAGLSLARTAYVYEDFLEAEELESLDFSLFGEEYELDLTEVAGVVIGEKVVKALVKKDLDTEQMNHSCIQGGYREISFYYSRILEEDCIDIVVRYYVRIPIGFFGLDNLRMIQRVRLRAWTGHQVPATYSIIKEDTDRDETMVFITDTGTVYHNDRNCTHISIHVEEVIGIPYSRRNDSGGKYYPCENCCVEGSTVADRYFITSDGERYHTRKDCSSLKRTVKQVPLSEVSDRALCKRCGN